MQKQRNDTDVVEYDGELICLVHVPARSSVWRVSDEQHFTGDKELGWLQNLVHVSLLHGSMVQFGSYTLESAVELTKYVKHQHRLWHQHLKG